MNGAILPLLKYAFMAWCSTGTTLPSTLPNKCDDRKYLLLASGNTLTFKGEQYDETFDQMIAADSFESDNEGYLGHG
jgi:hypothetical protein